MHTTCLIPRSEELSPSPTLPETRTTTTPTTTTTTTTSSDADDMAGQLDELARSIADDGIAGHEHGVRRFANLLLGRRLDRRSAVLLDVMTDSEQPSVARERAFGHLHSLALTHHGGAGRQAA